MRSDSEVKQEALDFINKQNTAVLATIDENSRPNAAVIYFLMEGEFNIYFTSKTTTRKLQNIDKNPGVSINFYDEDERYFIEIEGDAEIVEDEDEQIEKLNKLAKVRHSKSDQAFFPPVSQITTGDLELIKIIPKFVKIANYKRPAKPDKTYIDELELK